MCLKFYPIWNFEVCLFLLGKFNIRNDGSLMNDCTLFLNYSDRNLLLKNCLEHYDYNKWVISCNATSSIVTGWLCNVTVKKVKTILINCDILICEFAPTKEFDPSLSNRFGPKNEGKFIFSDNSNSNYERQTWLWK